MKNSPTFVHKARRIVATIVVLSCAIAFAASVNTDRVFAACGGTPVVTTDKADYGPLESVQLSGTGFDCGVPLTLHVTTPAGMLLSGDGTGSASPISVVTDGTGEFALSYALSGTLSDGSAYIGQEGTYTVGVFAQDGTPLATTTFTDSHLRAGQISWVRSPGTRTVNFTVLITYRSGSTSSSIGIAYGDGSSGSLSGSLFGSGADSTGLQYTIVRYTGSHTYPHDGPFTASFNTCCRISGLSNTGASNFSIRSIVDLANNNSGSPVSSSPAILQMVRGGVNNIPLTVTEDINDTINCRMASSAESGISTVASTPNHTLSVTNNCVLQWDTSETQLGRKYAVQVIIEGTHAGRISSASQDFIIEIVDGNPPTCSPSGNSYTVQVGQSFSTSITGTDPDNQPLTISHQGLPTGASLSPAPGSTGPSPRTGTFSWTPTSASAGTNTAVTIVFADSSGLQTQCGFTILVPANVSPTAHDDSFTVVEDNVLAGNVLNNNGSGADSDPEGDTLTVSTPQLSGPANGVLVLNSDGSFTYTPAPNFAGTDSFTYRISDGNSFSAPATVTIQVTEVDDAPLAVADTASVSEDSSATSLDVLANDTDLDGGPKSIASVSQPANGTAAIAGDNLSLTYQPNSNYCNDGTPTDDFSYTLSSGSSATVAVTVTCLNDAPVADDNGATTNEDTPVAVTLTGSDLDGDALTFVVVTDPSHGTLSGSVPNLTYTPNSNYHGSDSFTFKVNDGTADSAIVTVALTVNAVNDTPMADNQTVSTPEDTPLNLILTGSDLDGDTLTFVVVTDPSHGTLSGSAPNLTYTPNSNYHGSDSFTFTVNDGTTDSAIATVALTVNAVNDAPVADAQAVSTPEDTPVAITLTGSDLDGDTLTYSIVTNPSHGTLSGSAPNLTYTPNSNYHGSDSFTFKVNDGTTDSAIATIALTVNPINDAPVADDNAVETDEDTPLALTLTGSDLDGDSLTYSVVTNPSHGTLSGSAPSLTYTPNADFEGTDSFTFKVHDGSVESNVATVSISVAMVNDAPVADDNAVETDEDTPLALILTGNDIDGDSLTYEVVTDPTQGSLSGSAPNLTYTPNNNYHGGDSFTFRVSDGILSSNIATVALTVKPVNDAPVADSANISTDEDQDVAITLTGNDLDGDSLTYEVVTNPTQGSLSGSAPNLTYAPNSNYHGADSFTFKVNDGNTDSEIATIALTINAVNDVPEADAQAVSTPEDTPVTITLTGSDLDGDTLTYSTVTNPSHGTLSGSAPNLTYTPNSNYHGSDSFTFKVNDGTTDSTPATVALTVNAVNDAPVADAQAVSTPEDTPVAITLTGSDLEGDTLTYSIVTNPSHGTLSGSAPNLTYTPNSNHHGADSFTFKVNDGTTDSTPATVALTVNPVNDLPVLGAITIDHVVAVNTTVNAYVPFTDVDLTDTHTALWSWGDGSTSAGTVFESNGSGSIGSQPQPDTKTYSTPGVYSIMVTVSDNQGGTDSTTFEYVVVYDPSGGFVTGGGWINSPQGAYTAAPDMTGKANFGFVSKYKKGANIPTGETQFQFKAGNLNFHSASYEWLVVAGSKAKYKGEGTINGAGNYGFMLTATDGDATNNGSPDTFRIKIWRKDSGEVVYDNQMGQSDDSYDGTELGSGNIVVHDAKEPKAGKASLEPSSMNDESTVDERNDTPVAAEENTQTLRFFLPYIDD